MNYKYLGDRLTRPELRGASCKAVKRFDGKCIRGRNSNMLVEFEGGERVNILARLLRKLNK
jgi:hypothetical protein